MSRVLAIVPAFNEQGSIEKVVNNLYLNNPTIDVVVVNDCSTDKTEEEVRKTKANLLSLPLNLGIGGAMQTGYIYAEENGYDFAVQVDGDGQHDTTEIKKLLETAVTQKADLVIGSRFIKGGSYTQKFLRNLGITIFRFITQFLLGRKIYDATSGFRLVNRQIIQEYAEYYPTDYPEPEVLVLLNKKGYKIVEVPVKMLKRETGKSFVTPLKATYYMIKVVMSMIIMQMRKVANDE
jgi:glycosyltransferase involved in cell wall biosynthesis